MIYNKHFLQSDAWASFQLSLGRTVYCNTGTDWSYMAIQESGTGNTRLYVPYGPIVSNVHALEDSLRSLKDLGVSKGVTFVRIEPTLPITRAQAASLGLKSVTYQQLQPHLTQIIDLTKSEETILAEMAQNSRNITRNYTKKGISIRQSINPDDISVLTTLLGGVAKRNHITTHSTAYFRAQADALFPLKAARLFIAEFENTPIAAALVYDSDTTRVYAHAAADDSFRKLQAGTALVGEMILDAKRRGLQQFDLYGITDSPDPHHPWFGFTKFKKSFGGTKVEYGGTWDLPLKQLPYLAYRSYQIIQKYLRSFR